MALVTLLFSVHSVGAVEVLRATGSGFDWDYAVQMAADHGWVMGHTSVSDLSVEEKKNLCGVRLSDDHRVPDLVIQPTGDYPSYFDYHDLNGSDWMTPVKSQTSRCGSCWAFSAVGTVEAMINLALDDPDYDVDLSEQELVSKCCGYCGDCSGGDPVLGLDYIQRQGIVKEECFPYQAQNSPCSPCNTTVRYNITATYHVKPDTVDAYKHALMKYGPLSVVLKVPEDWFYYTGGVYEPTWTSEDFGWANHAVVLCGWNDTGEYWIIKNSWSKRWGIDGYAYVKWGNLEKYHHAYCVWNPSIPSPTYWLSPVSAVAESEFAMGYGAEKAIDGNIGTFWFSDYSENSSWIKFDLGDSVRVDRVRLMIYERDVPMDIKIFDDNDRILVDQTILVGNEFVEIPLNTKTRYLTLHEHNLPREFGTCSEFQYHVVDESDSYIEITYSDGSIERIDKEVSEVSVFVGGTETLKYRR